MSSVRRGGCGWSPAGGGVRTKRRSHGARQALVENATAWWTTQRLETVARSMTYSGGASLDGAGVALARDTDTGWFGRSPGCSQRGAGRVWPAALTARTSSRRPPEGACRARRRGSRGTRTPAGADPPPLLSRTAVRSRPAPDQPANSPEAGGVTNLAASSALLSERTPRSRVSPSDGSSETDVSRLQTADSVARRLSGHVVSVTTGGPVRRRNGPSQEWDSNPRILDYKSSA